MAEGREDVRVSEIEDVLRQLPTVSHVAVTANDWGAIEEVHVLSTTERTAKQIVRDVETTLASRWKMKIDHKKISVAQIIPQTAPAVRPRPIVREFRLDRDPLRGWAEIAVELQAGDATYTGEWEGAFVSSQAYQVMAEATVRAINVIPFISEPFVLQDVQLTQVAHNHVVVVAVGLPTMLRQERIFIGAAIDREEGYGAGVLAVLDAVNRFIGLSH